MSATLDSPLWVIIPAAGMGERMGATIPKQYLSLSGQSILQRTVRQLLQLSDIDGVVVVLSADDAHWQSTSLATDQRVHTCHGGQTRALSVVSGLQYVSAQATPDTWVLVHDAARPLVALSDVQRLLDAVYNSGSDGGILAVPVQDTLKRADDYHMIDKTVSRQQLWQAQTPQMFRCQALLTALQSALSEPEPVSGANPVVTDEASAMEMAGYSPLLVEALQPNFKITRPGDLQLAEALIKHSEVAG